LIYYAILQFIGQRSDECDVMKANSWQWKSKRHPRKMVDPQEPQFTYNV
jgi:hypothetical protein